MSYKITVINYFKNETIYAQGPEQRSGKKPIVELLPGKKMVSNYNGKAWVFMRGSPNSCASYIAKPNLVKGTFTVNHLGVHSATKVSPWKIPVFS